LQVLDPDTRLATRVLSSGADLYLVGGGDPTLARTPATSGYPRPAALSDLARAVARSGVRRVTGRIVADGSLFTGPRLGPGWKPTYVTEGSVAPVTALELDGGRIPHRDARQPQPDLAAAAAFREELRRAGVAVDGGVVRGRASAAAAEVARVESPPVPALVERMLARSDNDLAEALGRHVALALGRPADFAGASAAVSAAAGVDGLQDSCGLSRLDRLSPRDLVTLLRQAATMPRLRHLLTALPVAGFTGTLATRYDEGGAVAAAGWVRAKTGSLDNVSTLAGVVQTRGGRLLLFAFAADRLPTKYVSAAARALDLAATALQRCGCV
jgi:D-alanyl-D-alanine carboxypeptidase/D-alanyl-D-alanine-endopeptidase (penicillin-binding protein 4)